MQLKQLKRVKNNNSEALQMQRKQTLIQAQTLTQSYTQVQTQLYVQIHHSQSSQSHQKTSNHKSLQNSECYQLIEQYKSKIQSLQQINKQLTGIIESTQLQEYSQLVNQINQLETKHNLEIGNYKLKVMQLENQIAFTEKQKNNQIQQLSDKVTRTQRDILHYKSELKKLSKQLVHYRQNYQKARKQLKNQQALIDSFKMSIDEQITLEKEVLKSNFLEKQFQLKSQYQQKIKSIEQTYKKKLSKISQGGLENQYKKQLKSLGKYLSQKKNSSSAYMSNGKQVISVNNNNIKLNEKIPNQTQELTVFAVSQEDANNNNNNSIRKEPRKILGQISINTCTMHSDKGLGSKYSTIHSHKKN